MPDTCHTFTCPAKLNLALSVAGPRPEDGYHPISSWMVRVSLVDDLLIEPRDTDPTHAEADADSLAIEWAPDALLPSPIDWPLRDDLAFRAHRLLEAHLDRPLPIRARLLKRIPVGAGLAGGSSNGAGMLRALNELFDLKLDTPTLTRLAGQLGSDLAFFLGPPSAIVAGTGDRLEAAPLARTLHMVLILPALQCSTAAVYRAFDQLHPNAQLDASAVRRAAESAAVTDELLFNDLAEAAMTVEPDLREVHFRCTEAANRPVHITGSGAAMFTLAEDAHDAARLAEHLRRDARLAAYPAQTLPQ